VLFLRGYFSSPICFLLTNSLAFHSGFDIAALTLTSGHSTSALPAFRALFLPLPSPSFTLWTFVPYSYMCIWYHWRLWVLGTIQHFNSTYLCRMRIRRLAMNLLFGNHQWNVSLCSFSFPAAAVKVLLSSANIPFAGSCESNYWALYLRRWSFAENSSPFYLPPRPTFHEHTFSHLFFSPVSPFRVVVYSPSNPPFSFQKYFLTSSPSRHIPSSNTSTGNLGHVLSWINRLVRYLLFDLEDGGIISLCDVDKV
jgi:hypothetical protein